MTHGFGELPIKTAVALKLWKESKTTFEGNEHHPSVNGKAVAAGNGPRYPSAAASNILWLLRLRLTASRVFPEVQSTRPELII